VLASVREYHGGVCRKISLIYNATPCKYDHTTRPKVAEDLNLLAYICLGLRPKVLHVCCWHVLFVNSATRPYCPVLCYCLLLQTSRMRSQIPRSSNCCALYSSFFYELAVAPVHSSLHWTELLNRKLIIIIIIIIIK
jgi:hypothetical protein